MHRDLPFPFPVSPARGLGALRLVPVYPSIVHRVRPIAARNTPCNSVVALLH